MVSLKDLNKISEYEWEIPKSFRQDMRVPVRLFATRRLLDKVMEDQSLEQAVNAATLPGLVGQVVVMPDMHQGYGFPVGGVAATRLPDGVISPGGIGFDINCGVRLLVSDLRDADVAPYIEPLVHEMSRSVPAGYGRHGRLALMPEELDRVLGEGCPYLVHEH